MADAGKIRAHEPLSLPAYYTKKIFKIKVWVIQYRFIFATKVRDIERVLRDIQKIFLWCLDFAEIFLRKAIWREFVEWPRRLFLTAFLVINGNQLTHEQFFDQ